MSGEEDMSALIHASLVQLENILPRVETVSLNREDAEKVEKEKGIVKEKISALRALLKKGAQDE